MTPDLPPAALLMETTAAAVAEVYAMEKPSMSDDEWRRILERAEVREKGDG